MADDTPSITTTTETGCRVATWATTRPADSYFGTEGNGVYLGLSMAHPRDDRRAELKMTAIEARRIASNLVRQAEALEDSDSRNSGTQHAPDYDTHDSLAIYAIKAKLIEVDRDGRWEDAAIRAMAEQLHTELGALRETYIEGL